jgi:catechol 2,3-dioxygenase-like lactoylglutathione lyase family enzyme
VLETKPPLFDHVTLSVRDLSLSRAFYVEALKPFDVRVVQSSQGPLGFATDGRGDFWIKEGAPVAAPVHVAFAARDRATVDAFHRVAVQAGGTDNGPPGLRPTMARATTRHMSSTLTATTSRPSSTTSSDVYRASRRAGARVSGPTSLWRHC